MKNKILTIAVLSTSIGFAGQSQAVTTYTMDFDESVERTSASGMFNIDAFPSISAASMDFVIRGKTTYYNSRGDGWYYDPNIDLSIAGATALDDYHLGGEFTVLHFELSAAVLASMTANQTVNFSILAQDGFWWSDLSPWGGVSQTRFYLDTVSLQVSPSAVPLPGSIYLLGAGLFGLAGIGRLRLSR